MTQAVRMASGLLWLLLIFLMSGCTRVDTPTPTSTEEVVAQLPTPVPATATPSPIPATSTPTPLPTSTATPEPTGTPTVIATSTPTIQEQIAAATDTFDGLPGHAWDADSLMEHMEQMDVLERDRFWDELTNRPDLWGEDRLYWEGGYYE